jgi:hypothetical protein
MIFKIFDPSPRTTEQIERKTRNGGVVINYMGFLAQFKNFLLLILNLRYQFGRISHENKSVQ